MLLRMMVERHVQAGHQPGRWQLFLASALTVISVVVLLVFPYLIMAQTQILHPAANLAEVIVSLRFASTFLRRPYSKPSSGLAASVTREIRYYLFLLHS